MLAGAGAAAITVAAALPTRLRVRGRLHVSRPRGLAASMRALATALGPSEARPPVTMPLALRKSPFRM